MKYIFSQYYNIIIDNIDCAVRMKGYLTQFEIIKINNSDSLYLYGKFWRNICMPNLYGKIWLKIDMIL